MSMKHLEKKLWSQEREKRLLEKFNEKLTWAYSEQKRCWKESEQVIKKRSYAFFWDSNVYQTGYSELIFKKDIWIEVFQQAPAHEL